MSSQITWITAGDAEIEIHDKGEDLGYPEPIAAELGLFIGTGDGLLIEGSRSELLALLSRLQDRVRVHVAGAPLTESECQLCGEEIELVDPDDGKGAGWIAVDDRTRFCEDDDSGSRHEPSQPNY